MQDNSLPPYDDVSWALRHASDVASPSESHGLLCGLFCTGAAGRMDGITWAKSAAAAANSENQTCDDEQIGILEELFNATQAKLTSMEFDFELLLPDDESGLEMRASELGSWCLGFVTGLALGGLEIGVNDSHHDEDTREALQRLAEISRHSVVPSLFRLWCESVLPSLALRTWHAVVSPHASVSGRPQALVLALALRMLLSLHSLVQHSRCVCRSDWLYRCIQSQSRRFYLFD